MSSTESQTIIARLPGVLCDLFPGAQRRVEVEAGTVSEMLDALDRLWPGIAHRIRDETPAVRKHINIFVDGEQASLDTPLPKGCEVFILTAISGG